MPPKSRHEHHFWHNYTEDSTSFTLDGEGDNATTDEEKELGVSQHPDHNIDGNDQTFADYVSGAKAVDLEEGTRIGRYLIVSLIGKGGMGAVYKAYDPELDRRIAIKILTLTPKKGETASNNSLSSSG